MLGRSPATVARAAIAVTALTALLGAPAAAAPPMEGSGTGTITSVEITSSREAGGNVIQERTLTGTVSGTLDGTFVEHVRGVIHDRGHVTFQGTMQFTGTVEGCGAGSVTLGLSGRGVAGLPVTDAQMRVISHATNTIDVTGTGTVHQQGPSLVYDIRYVC